MSIREKVARALWEAEYGQDKAMGTWSDIPDHWRDESHEHATAAITAFLEAAAEQGWHMRPDEATEEMAESGPMVPIWAKNAWQAMCEAAPKFEWDK